MSAVLEEIMEKVSLLSENEKKTLVEKVEEQRKENARAERHAFIDSLKGKYRDALPSVDEFISRQQEEIEMEDKGWQPPR